MGKAQSSQATTAADGSSPSWVTFFIPASYNGITTLSESDDVGSTPAAGASLARVEGLRQLSEAAILLRWVGQLAEMHQLTNQLMHIFKSHRISDHC